MTLPDGNDEAADGVQIHDYNPGYWGGWPSGVFWTMAVPNPSVVVNPGAGTARWRMDDLAIPDYIDLAGALVDPDGAEAKRLPGKVSFDVRWTPKPEAARYQYEHPADDSEPDSYRVDYRDTAATLEWSGETPDLGFSFTSYEVGHYPDGLGHGQHFAVVGHERSGVFF